MNIEQRDKKEIVDFKSLSEFYDYIMNTPVSETFRARCGGLSSISSNYSFTKTKSFEEAVDLLKHGWSEMSEKLNQMLKVEMGRMEKVMVSKNILGVQGYQPIVPLFLNGIPTNMVSRKMQPMKQKVITINKSVNYSARVTSDTIVEESVKALVIIKKLENQNYRCNLNIILGTEDYHMGMRQGYVAKVRIKSANERLNINKLSFPLVHPSMLRRLFFRFIEVHPGVPRAFLYGYGSPMSPEDLRSIYPNEILLPQFIMKDIKSINTLDELEKLSQ